MCEILFKGKRVDNGEWVYGNLFIPDSLDKPVEILIGTNVVRISYKIIPETIGRYTGLTDKNGTKIFDGDIVKADNGHVSEVTFHFGAFCCYCHCHDTYNTLWSDILTVIGNIHDNPELLKRGKNNG